MAAGMVRTALGQGRRPVEMAVLAAEPEVLILKMLGLVLLGRVIMAV
jgi:hypothetical protein